jgi:mannan polymerase II complex MNN10 subunit
MSEAPSPGINFIAMHDPNGLNNGIFLLRVSQWAVSLFTAILAYHHYNPDVHLRFSEQSAMELLLADDEFKD